VKSPESRQPVVPDCSQQLLDAGVSHELLLVGVDRKLKTLQSLVLTWFYI
jgi:hypothetical protein